MFRAAGDLLYYSFEITNTGETTLTKFNITDAKLGLDVTLYTTLKPNQSYTYYAYKPYVITEADLELGEVLNTVTVKGTGPDGSTPEVPAEHHIPSVPPTPDRSEKPKVPETGEKSASLLAAAGLLLTAAAAFVLRTRYEKKEKDPAKRPTSRS